MAEAPTLFVCHGDDGGPRIHPCRRVQEALRAAGTQYDKVIAAHGSPVPFLCKGSRDERRLDRPFTARGPRARLFSGRLCDRPGCAQSTSSVDVVVHLLSVEPQPTEEETMRSMGLDIHRDFCGVAIAEGGDIRSPGASR